MKLRHDTQQNDIQQIDTQHNETQHYDSIKNTQHIRIECHYSECRVFYFYAECLYAKRR
jgi:hypothetical protein